MTRLLTILLSASATAWAQAPATQPAVAAATQPVGSPGQARVILVTGNVSFATVNAQGERGDWRPAKVGDLLPAGTQIRTQIRSKVGLSFGDNTVVVIDRATLASIDQYQRTGDSQTVGLGLGHGMIRGSAVETALRSDMTIQTPTATLSKRGTRDFGIEYDPSTGRFQAWLGGEGLVEAINWLTAQSRLVRPGQYATQAMLRWIETLSTDRWVPVVDTFGMTSSEMTFNREQGQNSGLAVTNPGGGATTFAGPGASTPLSVSGTAQQGTQILPLNIAPGVTVIPRPEGNFGTRAAKALRNRAR